MNGFRRLGEREVHRGHVWHVVVADFEAPDGSRFQRDIVRSPGAVGVLPLFDGTDDGRPAEVVLIRQWRPPYEAVVWEIPAGVRDVADEPPERTARRELVEEAGLEAADVELLTRIGPSPGMTDSITWIFLATGLTAVAQDLHGPEEEHLEVVRLPLQDALALVDAGEITDAKTVVALLLAARRRNRTA